jgi:excinuclease UvrABC helicase subunit UvrB
MKKTFNELFEEFFKKTITPVDKTTGYTTTPVRVIKINLSTEEDIDKTLGPPDRIEFTNEGNLFFEKRIWKTENGDIVKLISTDDPMFERIEPVREVLKKQLEDALEKEEFEKAAAIRDLLKKGEKKTK